MIHNNNITVEWVEGVISSSLADKERGWEVEINGDFITISYLVEAIIDPNPDPQLQNDFFRSQERTINILADDTEDSLEEKIINLVNEVEQIPLITQR